MKKKNASSRICSTIVGPYRTTLTPSAPAVHRQITTTRTERDQNAPPNPSIRTKQARTHTLISQFETPARIICETINPAPLLEMFFGGRHYSNDFRSPGNAMPCLVPPHPAGEDAARNADTDARRCRLFCWYNCMNDEYVLLLVREMIFFVRPKQQTVDTGK